MSHNLKFEIKLFFFVFYNFKFVKLKQLPLKMFV